MFSDDADAFLEIEQTHVDAFADHDRWAIGKDAGKGDVEKGQDADRRGFDDMVAKAKKVAGSGTAGIDQCGCPAALGNDC